MTAPSLRVERNAPGKNGAAYVDVSCGVLDGAHIEVCRFELYVPASGFPRMPETKFGRQAVRLAKPYMELLQAAMRGGFRVGDVLS